MLFRKLKVLAVLMLVMSAAGCALFEPESEYDKTEYDRMKDGLFPPVIPDTEGQLMARVQVVDASTMQPIEGAIVLGGYYGLGRNAMTCFASESAVTDQNGYAWLPNDRDERVREGKKWRRGPRLVSAYKRGYQLMRPPYAVNFNWKTGAEGWYVWERKPIEKLPLILELDKDKEKSDWKETILSGPYPDKKSALLASKERSTTYLYPSTAATKEERWKELDEVDNANGCGWNLPLPFRSFESEGALPIRKATYQERLEIGFKEDDLSRSNDIIKSIEKGVLWQRERVKKGEIR